MSRPLSLKGNLSLTRRSFFSPVALFASGAQGYWFDESDLTTMYQDTAGTTAAAVGSVVGLHLDKSRGLVLGAELADPLTATANVAVNNGVVTFTNAATSDAAFRTSALTIGKTYLVSFRVVSISAGVVRAYAGSSAGLVSASAPGTYTGRVVAAGNQTLSITAIGTTTAVVDQISFRELPGNHRTQSTTASKPILARVPFGGRRNVLTASEDFSVGGGAWLQAAATITPNVATAPSGSGADKIVPSTASNTHAIYRAAYTVTAGQVCSLSVVAKADGYDYLSLGLNNGAITAGNEAIQSFNLANGTVGATYNTAPTSATIESLGSGYYRCTITWTISTTSANPTVFVANTAASPRTSWAADGTSGIIVADGQFELGTATAYQKVTSTYDVTETGKADCYHLVCDGVDDFMVTGTIPFADGLASNYGASLRANGVVGVVGTATAASYDTGTGAASATRVDSANQSYVQWGGLNDAKTYEVTFTVSTNAVVLRTGGPTGTIVTGASYGAGTYTLYAQPTSGLLTFGANGAATSTFTVSAIREVLNPALAPDKMTVFAGVRKPVENNSGTIIEHSTAADANSGALFLRASSGALANYQSHARGSSSSSTTPGIAAPDTSVVALSYDISGDRHEFRRNGVQAGLAVNDLGTGTFGSYPVYFGRRGGSSLPFNGHMYGEIAVQRTLTAAEIATVERYLSAKVGVTL